MVHHMAVRVSLNIVLEPLDWRVHSQKTTLTSWHAHPGILKDASSESLCSVRVEEVGEGHNV